MQFFGYKIMTVSHDARRDLWGNTANPTGSSIISLFWHFERVVHCPLILKVFLYFPSSAVNGMDVRYTTTRVGPNRLCTENQPGVSHHCIVIWSFLRFTTRLDTSAVLQFKSTIGISAI